MVAVIGVAVAEVAATSATWGPTWTFCDTVAEFGFVGDVWKVLNPSEYVVAANLAAMMVLVVGRPEATNLAERRVYINGEKWFVKEARWGVLGGLY